MATTRKTTAKKPAARAAKPRVTVLKTKVTAASAAGAGATSSRKTAVKKSVAKTAVKTTVSTTNLKTASARPSLNVSQQLRRWNFVAALLQAAQAVAIVMLARDVSYPVTTSYTTTDSLASLGGEEVLVSASRTLMDMNMAYLLAAVFGVAAVTHLSLATWYRRRYETEVDGRLNRARWIGLGLVFGLSFEAVALVLGVQDKGILLFGLVGTVVMSLIGLALEVNGHRSRSLNRTAYSAGLLAGFAPWMLLAWTAFASSRYGEVTFEPYVYVLLGSMFVLFAVFAGLQYLAVRARGRWADYVNLEKAYLLLSLITTAALAWQIYAGVLRQS